MSGPAHCLPACLPAHCPALGLLTPYPAHSPGLPCMLKCTARAMPLVLASTQRLSAGCSACTLSCRLAVLQLTGACRHNQLQARQLQR